MENEPALYPGDDFFLSAFYRLSSCRQYGTDLPGPIPWDKIVQYADRAELDEENKEVFVHVIQEMDGGYLKRYERKQEAKRPKGKKGSKFHGRL